MRAELLFILFIVGFILMLYMMVLWQIQTLSCEVKMAAAVKRALILTLAGPGEENEGL